MNKKYFLTAVCLSFCLLITGCATKKGPDKNTLNDFKQGQEQFKQDFGTKGSLQNLAIGIKADVFGTKNSDETITASRILIGDIEEMAMRQARGQFPTSTGQMPENGDRPNMTPPQDGERRGRFQGGQGGGQAGQAGGQRTQMKNFAHFFGEILKKDDTSITLKMSDGSSKIIFISSKTEVFVVDKDAVKSATSTPTP